jgi:hypothetical protein
VGRAAALLDRRGAAVAVLAALALYYAFSEELWDVSTWPEVTFISLVLIPLVFALVGLALPLRRAPGLLLLGLAFVVAAAVLTLAELDVLANFAKLGATTALGFWFLTYFESVTWLGLVALLIPWVDAFSVWRGPTRHIVEEEREVFETLSFAFPIPGEAASANLGVPDLLFFAIFLGGAARFGLRVGWTWLAMTLSFGVTLTLAVWIAAAGFPALPGLCLGFLGPNADLLWHAFRQARTSG